MEEDLRWLITIAKQAGIDPSKWESGAHLISLLKSLNKNIKSETADLLVLGCTGWLLSLARAVDEKRFFEIDPVIYLQSAFLLVDPSSDEGKWQDFLKRTINTK